MAWFAPDLEVVHEVRLPVAGFQALALAPQPRVFGVSASGEVLAWTHPVLSYEDFAGTERLPSAIVAIDTAGSVQMVAKDLPGEEYFFRNGGMLIGFDPVFSKHMVYRPGREGIYTLDTADGLIALRGRDGEVRLRVSFPVDQSEPTGAQVDSAVARAVAGLRNPTPEAADYYRQSLTAGPPPVLSDFVVDTEGALWVWFDPLIVPRARGLVMRVRPDERSLRWYEVPERFTPYGARSGRLWGIERDALDVESFVVMALPN